MERIHGLDFLRGFSILLMFADHVLAIALFEGIYPLGGRYWTRLSEPLFALLFGYFLYRRDRRRLLTRMVEILGVAIIINIAFYAATGRIEILGSFLAAGTLYFLIGDKFRFLFPMVFLYPIDPTRAFLDYPLSLVFGQIALGMLLRKDVLKGIIASLIYASAFLLVNPPWQYTVYFTLPAVLIMAVFLNFDTLRSLKLEPINFIGRKPLLSYGVQYLLAVLIGIIYLSITGRISFI